MTGTRHTGSCLCGAVRFEVHGAFEAFYLCHCSRCRKDTGSAHASNLFSPNGRLIWRSGRELVRTFRLAGTRHARSFCSTCGSALPCAGEGHLAVPAGSLDTVPAIKPQARLFTANRAAWDEDPSALPMHEGLPPARGGA